MKGKNRILVSSIAILVAISVFATSAVVALGQNAGYENFKNAAINSFFLENFEVDATCEIEADGKVVVSESVSMKVDGVKQTGTHGGEGLTYYQDENGNTVYKDGKILYEYGYSNHYDKEEMNESYLNLINVIIDTVVGDAKNSIMTEDNKVMLNLSEEQIPALAQAVLTFASEKFKNQDYSRFESYNEVGKTFTNTVNLKDLSIKNVEFVGEYSESGYIKSVYCLAEVGGYDSNGEYQNANFLLDVKISNVGTTVVTKPNITEYADNYENNWAEAANEDMEDGIDIYFPEDEE